MEVGGLCGHHAPMRVVALLAHLQLKWDIGIIRDAPADYLGTKHISPHPHYIASVLPFHDIQGPLVTSFCALWSVATTFPKSGSYMFNGTLTWVSWKNPGPLGQQCLNLGGQEAQTSQVSHWK